MLFKVSKVVLIFILGNLAHVGASAQEFVIDDKHAETNSVGA
jgi:hypothetical protein